MSGKVDPMSMLDRMFRTADPKSDEAAPFTEAVYPRGTRINESGVLEFGGVDALTLAEHYGTPAYIVVEDDARFRARQFVDAYARYTEPDFSEVIFASKAFGATAAFALMHEEGLGCDVASAGELFMAMNAGFRPEQIYFHGNAKTQHDIEEAIRNRVGHVVADNFQDLDRLESLLQVGQTQRILLRVAPGVEPRTHRSISTGQENTKFGFNKQDAREAIRRVQRSSRLELQGLHIHLGSQIMDPSVYVTALNAIIELGSFPTISVGGGLGVAYTVGDVPPTIDDYVRTKVEAVHHVYGSDTRIVEEPGRALFANAGVTLYRVQSVKRNVSNWVAVDGGMSDNLRPMLYQAKYDVQIVDRFGGVEEYEVVGKHCESGDVLVSGAVLPDPEPGDVLVTPVTGAYGHSMANSYNGHYRPPVVFVKGGKHRLVVRRETPQDLIERDVNEDWQ